MFDWISDVIDYIGGGISSAWDNTVGVITSETARVIYDAMFDWVFITIYDAIASLQKLHKCIEPNTSRGEFTEKILKLIVIAVLILLRTKTSYLREYWYR
ncbi:hypothetical protein [Ruminococcus flavefaciens]|uniref:hypothetical protein n=1 Tax=Ruminococcus flavefaciens TaxID=1265 RepID=UPI00048ACF00|nr:hypothetical protein [Ruminococcus flavefaciens]